jgi:trehalose 6-phosphate synthase/phosphatase
MCAVGVGIGEQKKMDELLARYAGRKIIVSMDRLDPCKGIPQKLMAIERLLENYPEWRGNVVMFTIIRERERLGQCSDRLFL